MRRYDPETISLVLSTTDGNLLTPVMCWFTCAFGVQAPQGGVTDSPRGVRSATASPRQVR